MTKEEFEKLYSSKQSTAMLLERIFNPQKYPDFHAYLENLHEDWIKSMKIGGG